MNNHKLIPSKGVTVRIPTDYLYPSWDDSTPKPEFVEIDFKYHIQYTFAFTSQRHIPDNNEDAYPEDSVEVVTSQCSRRFEADATVESYNEVDSFDTFKRIIVPSADNGEGNNAIAAVTDERVAKAICRLVYEKTQALENGRLINMSLPINSGVEYYLRQLCLGEGDYKKVGHTFYEGNPRSIHDVYKRYAKLSSPVSSTVSNTVRCSCDYITGVYSSQSKENFKKVFEIVTSALKDESKHRYDPDSKEFRELVGKHYGIGTGQQ